MARVPWVLMHSVAVATLVLTSSVGARADANAGTACIYVSTQNPERLYLIDGGEIIFESPVNTGIRAAPTPVGAFRVFASYAQRTMKGTDPVTWRPYNDPNVPYVMYFDGGRAIHGFRRNSYGYPQSFGCVELPIYKARELYQLLQGGLDTEVVVANRRPVLGRRNIGFGGGWVRPVLAGSEGRSPGYRANVGVVAGTLLPP